MFNQEEEKKGGTPANVYIKQGIIFRAQRYSDIGLKNLNPKNNDYFEIKKKLSKSYKPLDCISDQKFQDLNSL